MELNDEEQIKQICSGGKDWVIKRKNHQYYYRAEREYGEWKTGLPPDTFQPEVDLFFEDK